MVAPTPRRGRRLAPVPPPPPSPPAPAPVPRPQNTRTIEIEHFVPRSQLDPGYYDKPYYIVPRDRVGQEAFAVIREAMRGKDMVALGRVVMSKRERVIALEPYEKGLLGTTLRYPYEVREASNYFEDIADIKIPADMRKLAEHILDSKAGDFDPSTFVDQYEVALVDLLKKKEAGIEPQKAAAAAPERRVVNLMDALRKSIEAEAPRKPAAGQAAARRQSTRKRA